MNIEWVKNVHDYFAFDTDTSHREFMARVQLGGTGYWCMWRWEIESYFWPDRLRAPEPYCKTLAGIKRRAEKYITLWVIAGRPK